MGKLAAIIILIGAGLAGVAAAAFGGAPVIGTAIVIDGDTIEIHGERIRLDAIDAPESRQQCNGPDGSPYPCGRRAAFALADMIGRAPVRCETQGRDKYHRIIGICFKDLTNLNGWMVDQGWAVAFRKYGNDYVHAEDQARLNRRGLWSGTFAMPWDWRASRREPARRRQ